MTISIGNKIYVAKTEAELLQILRDIKVISRKTEKAS